MRYALSLPPRAARLAMFSLAGLSLSIAGCNWLSSQHANNTGQVLYKFGNYTAAAHEFHRAAIDDPNNADVFHNLAAARLKQGNMAAAETAYRQAIQVNPGHQPSYHGLASLLKQQNRHGEALAMLETWKAAEPYRTAPYVETAWLQREMGDTMGATQTLQTALRVQPNNATVLSHLGQIYQDSGQRETAVAMYQRSLYGNWYQPEVHSRLAALQERPTMRTASGMYPPVSRYGMIPTPATGVTAFNADPAHVPETAAKSTTNARIGNKANGSTPR